MTGVFRVEIVVGDQFVTIDGLEHEGRNWLVPSWYEYEKGGVRRPGRLVCLDSLEHQPSPPELGHAFFVNVPIPKAVLYGDPSPEEADGFEIVMEPLDLWLPLEPTKH